MIYWYIVNIVNKIYAWKKFFFFRFLMYQILKFLQRINSSNFCNSSWWFEFLCGLCWLLLKWFHPKKMQIKKQIFNFYMKSTEIDYAFKMKNLLCNKYFLHQKQLIFEPLQVVVHYNLPASLAFEICLWASSGLSNILVK